MTTKYKILICSGFLAIFAGVYGFTGGDIQPTSKHTPAAVKKQRQAVALEKQASHEDTVAAILIMPKSYLPALKKFSQSLLARDIKILRAELEVKDGQMTAVRQLNHLNRPNPSSAQADKPAGELPEAISQGPPKREKQMVSSGLLYLMAGLQKHRFVR
jgi:hypothetical protein